MTVIAESNGHHWIKWRQFTCCRDCGIIRRADDKNKPCKGVVKVGPRVNKDGTSVKKESRAAT